MAPRKSTTGETTICKACPVKSYEKKVNIDETTTTTYNNGHQRHYIYCIYNVHIDCLWPV
jgi:hypothetical protein